MYATIHNITPFDVTKGTTINFTWQGNQIFKVRCIVKENESGKTVYDKTVDSMKQYFEMPANSGLSNGKYYICYITVFDVDSVESDLQSIGTPFYCFTTPTWKLSVEDGAVLKNSSYEILVSYAQKEAESLNSYSISLYSYQKTLIQTSGNVYNTTTPLSYTITGLKNATQYYIRAIGTTLHGFELDTGYVLISAQYVDARVFASLALTNLADIGAISIVSNIISVLGVAGDPSKLTYIDPSFVDLTKTTLTFQDGFNLPNDSSFVFAFYNPKINSSIFVGKIQGQYYNETLEIIYRKGSYSNSNGTKAYCELRISNESGVIYTIQSNYFNEKKSTQQYAVLVNRANGYYEIKVAIIDKPTS